MNIGDFFEHSHRAGSLHALFGVLVAAARDDGFDGLAFSGLTHMEPLRLVDYPQPVIAINYAGAWLDHYERRNYFETDPVVRYTPRFERAFRWGALAGHIHLEPQERQVMNEAGEFGLSNGITVPLHGPQGRVRLLSLASRFADAGPASRLAHINTMALLFHSFFNNLADGPRRLPAAIRLTPREIECLKWTAQGKSSWDIGAILAISGNTVKFHVNSAMRKLGASSRAHAVIKAIRLGLIDLPQL
jgi:DNA-binding CsgD family transcriptional regulator